MTILNAERRRFLVQHLGEARVAEIEEALGQHCKELEGLGIAFKDEGLAAPGAIVSLSEAEARMRQAQLRDAFIGLASNILDGNYEVRDTISLLERLVGDFSARLNAPTGVRESAAAKYARDLLVTTEPTPAAVKDLRGQNPASEYVADLIERGPTLVEGS